MHLQFTDGCGTLTFDGASSSDRRDGQQARPLPSQGIVLLKLKSDVYGGPYDDEDFVQGMP